MLKFEKNTKMIMFILGCLLLTLPNCFKNTDPADTVLAIVGEKKITVREFRLNYEFGFPHLKKGPDRKRSYLDYMIKESILSQEGFKLGLDKTERVKKLEKYLLDELLVEELYQKEISDKINITQEQIQDAITKSKVKWKLRYWVEPNLFYAERKYKAMKEKGYAAAIGDVPKSNPQLQFKPADFESDYLNCFDVSEELLDAIKDLPVGDISAPIELNGKYFIFKVVDIRREPVSEYDRLNETERYRNLLYDKYFRKAAAGYVSEFMTAQNVSTKRAAFQILTDAVAEWKQMDTKSRRTFLLEIESADSLKPLLFKLQKSLNQTLVKFKGGKWTVKDFIDRFDPTVIKADIKEKDKFCNQINEQIALTVRDFFLAEKAGSMNLQKSGNINNQLTLWRDKFVYEEMKRHLIAGINGGDSLTSDEFEDRLNRKCNTADVHRLLLRKIDSLRTCMPIEIHESILDTITTLDANKLRLQSLQVFKKSNNRLALPVVDPAWDF